MRWKAEHPESTSVEEMTRKIFTDKWRRNSRRVCKAAVVRAIRELMLAPDTKGQPLDSQHFGAFGSALIIVNVQCLLNFTKDPRTVANALGCRAHPLRAISNPAEEPSVVLGINHIVLLICGLCVEPLSFCGSSPCSASIASGAVVNFP